MAKLGEIALPDDWAVPMLAQLDRWEQEEQDGLAGPGGDAIDGLSLGDSDVRNHGNQPRLNAVEHPVYDVWLTECAQPKLTSQPTQVSGRPGAGTAARGAAQGGQPPAQPGAQPQPASGNPDDAPAPRRRPPR